MTGAKPDRPAYNFSGEPLPVLTTEQRLAAEATQSAINPAQSGDELAGYIVINLNEQIP